MDRLFEEIKDKIDDIILNNIGEFPDGPGFLDGFEDMMKEFVDSNQIDSWSFHKDYDNGEWQVLIEKEGLQYNVGSWTDEGGRI